MMKRYGRYFSFCVLAALCINGASFAAVRLPAVFGDHMVLQQKAATAFWGWADAGETVTVQGSWSATAVSARTDASGRWTLRLPTPAAGGPFVVHVKGSGNDIELKDVLIGEVWLCSGQSNMVFSLKGSAEAAQEIPQANFPQIRYFSATRQYATHDFDDSPGAQWQLCTPQTAPSFSAVAYYFAKKIQQRLHVPVGILYSAWGGTPAEAWTPRPVLQGDTLLSRYIDRWKEICDKVGADSAAYHIALDNWEKNKSGKKPAEPQTLYYYERPWREPGVLYNGMIAPLIPYTIKGVLWYQGESNVAYADEYRQLLTAMIDSWRRAWGAGGHAASFPFYIVQIASYGYSSLDAAARLREAEYEVSKQELNSGLAVTVDLGDMGNIHYKRKKEAGDRLALIALARDYGDKNLVYKGPEAKAARAVHGKIILTFAPSAAGLSGAGGNVIGFEIGYRDPATDTVRFVTAQAKVEGNKVIIWNEQAVHPVQLRYAWLLAGEANLADQNGLPAFPFRMAVK